MEVLGMGGRGWAKPYSAGTQIAELGRSIDRNNV